MSGDTSLDPTITDSSVSPQDTLGLWLEESPTPFKENEDYVECRYHESPGFPACDVWGEQWNPTFISQLQCFILLHGFLDSLEGQPEAKQVRLFLCRFSAWFPLPAL